MRLTRIAQASAATPRLFAAAAREVVHADRTGTIVAAAYQIVGATAALGVVAAGKLTFDALLQPDRAAIGLAPALIALAFMTAVTGSVSALQAQQHRFLGERVLQRVWDGSSTRRRRPTWLRTSRPGLPPRSSGSSRTL